MAKKQFVTAPEPVEETQPEPAEEQVEVFADDSVQKIFSVLSTMNLSGGKVGIHLKRPNALKTTYEGYMTIEQFKEDGLETLKTTYGGGDYTLQFQDSNGKFVTSQNISIDPRFKGSIETPPAVNPSGGDKLGDDRLATALDKLRPAQPDNNGMSQILVAMIDANQKTLTAMMTAIAAQNKPAPPPPVQEPVLPILLELIRQKTDKTPISETIEAFATLRDLTSNGEPKEKEDMIEKFVKLVGPPLVSFFTRQGMPMMPPPAQLASGHGPQHQQAAPSPATNGAAPPSEPKLAQFTGLLLNAARRGTPAENYFDVVVDNITEVEFDTLVTELKKPDWLETLFGNHPDVIAQKGWFEKLRTTFLEEADELPDALAPAQQQEAAAAK